MRRAKVAQLHKNVDGRSLRGSAPVTIAPTQAIAVDKNNPAQDTLVVHTRLAVGLGKTCSGLAIGAPLSQ